MKANVSRDAVMAIHMDAGKDPSNKPREVYVYLDAGANVVGVTKVLEQEVPTFGPIEVKPKTYREMLRIGRHGNPTVGERRKGRWVDRPLASNLGEQPALRAVRARLLRGQSA